MNTNENSKTEKYQLVIDLSAIEDISQWEIKNSALSINPIIDSSKKEAYIEFDKEGTTDFKKLAVWLKENGEYINYEKSNSSIVEIHELYILPKLFQFGWREFKYTYIKDEFKKYKKYLKLSKNGIDVVDKHEAKHTFSVQLFDSIEKVKKVQDSDSIIFFYEPHSDEYMFHIGGTFFDISTPPPLTIK